MNITFVNEQDEVIGYGSKSEALSKGIIHRIVRIFVFNSEGKLLIQKRSPNVDVPNKWDQSAAGHVDEGEDYLEAGTRELYEEVGIKSDNLNKIGKFYSVEDDNDVSRKRFNVLYTLISDSTPSIRRSEVSSVKWVDIDELSKDMKQSPSNYTQGFIEAFKFYIKVNQ